MDLNVRVDVNFARTEVNFQTISVTKFYYIFFRVDVYFQTVIVN